MERKKLPNDLPLDALIEAAINESEALTSDVDILTSDVLAFLSHYKISSGKHRASPTLLYRLYKAWSKEKVKQSSFNLELSVYIQRETRYYLINKDPSELVPDLVFAIKKTKPPATRKKANWEHFKAYLNANNVASGNDWLEARILHHFYDKWAFNTKRKKALSLVSFYSFLKIAFETRKTREDIMVRIKNPFDKESIENIRAAWKRKQKGPK